MVIKELVGIHMGKDALYYCGAVRTPSAWKAAIPGAGMEPAGTIPGHPAAMLRELLLRVSPKSGRRIFLSLPRNRFFIRDVLLPPVPLEDALMSVQSSLPVTCHLPLDDIFHDIYLCRMPDGKVSALVIYALRKELLPVLEIFHETGHEKSLFGLFPVSLGIGAWLNLQKYDMPMGLVITQESPVGELAVYQRPGCIYSVSWQNVATEAEKTDIRESTCTKFHLSADQVFSLDPSGDCKALSDPLMDKLPWLPSIRQNLGAAALAAGLSNQQQILLNGDLPRIKVFQLWKLFVPAVLLLSALLFLWTAVTQRAIDGQKHLVSAMKAENQQLLNQLRPLEKNRDALKKAETLSADIEDFIRLRPRLFSAFNEIARLIPEGTWFSRCTLQGVELTLQGQSREALKVVEALRSSPLFEQVKLAGSVSRAPSGVEQFSLSIRLKDVEASP